LRLNIVRSSLNSKHSEYTKARISKSLKGVDKKRVFETSLRLGAVTMFIVGSEEVKFRRTRPVSWEVDLIPAGSTLVSTSRYEPELVGRPVSAKRIDYLARVFGIGVFNMTRPMFSVVWIISSGGVTGIALGMDNGAD
jgi:hypothetical protein